MESMSLFLPMMQVNALPLYPHLPRMTSLYGDVIISNHCPNSVYATEVGSSQTALRTLIPNQSTVFPIEVRDDGGFSIKITTTNLDNGVLQFEYTEQDDELWWDLSLIDKGNGTRMFVEEGINATTSCEGGKNVDCPAGDSCCHEVYQKPDDNQVIRVCEGYANITVNLCYGYADRT